VQWWYGHNAVAFFLTTPFLGLMYYFMPKAAERPVYSYRLSIIHFWSLIFLYIWAGPHHLLHSALPEWAQTLGVTFSIVLIAPSWGGMINGLLTLRGAFDKVRSSAVLKFLVLAITAYGMATFEGPMLALRSVNALSHDTDWTVGHVHSGALGWNGFLAFAMVYWMIPRIYGTKLWSESLANTHFWIATLGIVIYVVTMWISGITQGTMWFAFNEDGRLQYRDWIEILNAIKPFYWLRFIGGALYLTGILLCVVNIWKTMSSGKMIANELAEAPALVPDSDHEALIATAMAVKDPRERGNALHSLVERWPTLLSIMAALALIAGGVMEIVPSLIQGALAPKIATVTPYTPLELTGRDIYIREGCVGCHTQMIRTIRAEVERYGEYTRPGEGVYDRPFLWGSKRTGPDLAREGVIRPMAAWHYQHMLEPASVSPGTVMPAYPWLISDDIDLSDIQAKLSALAGTPIHTPYSAKQIINAVADTKVQALAVADRLRREDQRLSDVQGLENKEIIAVIAYLQRLGTDFGKTSAGK
jgi:cytochrome c oxidase cbb3-type subunit I/II